MFHGKSRNKNKNNAYARNNVGIRSGSVFMEMASHRRLLQLKLQILEFHNNLVLAQKSCTN